MTNRPLQQRHFGIELLQRLHKARDRQAREVAEAASLLGADHSLVRALDLLGVLRRQLALSSLTLGGGTIALAAGGSWATTPTLAAAIVALGLVVAVALVTSSRRDIVRELFIDGWGDLPLRPLVRERQRLTSPQTQARLARALERLVETAAAWPRIQRTARPVFDVRVVRAAAPLLTGIAEHLRSRPAPPRPLARIEWLLTAAASPLYGYDPAELACQLELIRRELARDAAK
jgi:hypothetical protein